MSKFITPVGMQVTQEQYEKDLKEPLLKLGYKEYSMWGGGEYPDLFAGCNKSNELNYLNRESFSKAYEIAYYINSYNPQLFLAIAAMTEGEDWIVGEWLVHGIKIFQCKSLDGHNSSLGYADNEAKDMYRKATKEELINHFTTNKQTDMKKDTIIGYKLTKPEYLEACRQICRESEWFERWFEENTKEGQSFGATEDNEICKDFRDAGVLDIWFTPVYKQQEQIFKVGNFEVKVKNGRVLHCGDDITEFTKGLINHFKPQTFGKYMMTVEDVTFSKTGCQTTSKLSEWLEVFKALNN